MMKILLFLLFVFHQVVYSAEQDTGVTASLSINEIFDTQRVVTIDALVDLIDREQKVDKCIDEYVKQQSKSYAKIVQNNLYDLIHNFDRIASKIYGKKPENTDIPYSEKIEILARIQCDIYYGIGSLR